MYLVADFGTHRAGTSTLHKATSVTVVPVLMAKLLVGHCERAEPLIESFPVLRRAGGEMCVCACVCLK